MALPDPVAFDLAQRLHSGDPTAIDQIRGALEQERTVTYAAIVLGITPRCLQRWLKRYPRLGRGIVLQGGGWPKGRARKPVRDG